MDIDEARKERNKLKLEMYDLEGEGASVTTEQRKHYQVLEKKVKKLNILIKKLKNKKGGRATRRR